MKKVTRQIVVFIEKISRKNGGLSSALDLAEAMQLIGNDVYLAINTGAFPLSAKKAKTLIPISKRIYVPRFLHRVGRKAFSFKNFKSVKTIIYVLHYFFIGRWKSYRVLRNADLFFFAGGFYVNNGMDRLRKISKAKYVLNHAGSPKTFEKIIPDSAVSEKILNSRKRYVKYCDSFDAILFQSTSQARECSGIDTALIPKCHVISPSCQEEAVYAASQLSSPYSRGRKAVVCIGSIKQRKAQHLCIEAFADVVKRTRDADLHFVGRIVDHIYYERLLEIIKKKKLEDRIFFHGHRDDYLGFMAHADVLVQSSIDEGVSRVLREAMLIRLPIVSFELSGTADLLVNGEDAFLVPTGDLQALGLKVSYILNDDALAKKITQSAYSRYMKNNSSNIYKSAISNFINLLMNNTINYDEIVPNVPRRVRGFK